MCIYCILADRSIFNGDREGAVRFSDIPRVQQHSNILEPWFDKFRALQDDLLTNSDASNQMRLVDPIPPGYELDGTLLQCMLKREYIHGLKGELKHEMKAKLLRAGIF